MIDDVTVVVPHMQKVIDITVVVPHMALVDCMSQVPDPDPIVVYLQKGTVQWLFPIWH